MDCLAPILFMLKIEKNDVGMWIFEIISGNKVLYRSEGQHNRRTLKKRMKGLYKAVQEYIDIDNEVKPTQELLKIQ